MEKEKNTLKNQEVAGATTEETKKDKKQEVKTEKDELKAKAADIMKQYGEDKVYRTSDGYWFTKETPARAHAQKNKLEVTEFKS